MTMTIEELAREGAIARIKELENQIAELRTFLNGHQPPLQRQSHYAEPGRKRKPLSPARRRQISEHMRASWARRKAAQR